MRHYNISCGPNRHYAVGHNGFGCVLIQLGEDISISPFHCQVRVALTVGETDHLIQLLQAEKLKAEAYPGIKVAETLREGHEGQEQAGARTQEDVDVSCMQGGDGKGQEALPVVQEQEKSGGNQTTPGVERLNLILSEYQKWREDEGRPCYPED